jgi:hypothetical protein
VCFVGVNALALRHWANWRETGQFLWDMALPGCYAALLISVIEYVSPAPGGIVMQLGAAMVKFIVFSATFAPLVYRMEHQTLLYAEFVRPVIERLVPSLTRR